jgi:hypothetical protein
MKKALLYFLLFITGFSFGQKMDTLVFRAGTKLAVKIFYIDKRKIYFRAPPSREKESVTKDQLDTVIYAKGFADPILPDYDSLKYNSQKGQLVINIGVGYSPGFDGDVGVGGVYFPVERNFEYFTCSSITPNLGAIIEYGITKKTSIGLAASYQSEIIDPDESPYTDFITRINMAVRILQHLNKRNPKFDSYIGIRFGDSYWTDVPTIRSYYPYSSSIPQIYFINKPSLWVPSVQLLYGMRIYLSNSMGIHFEVGIGSPYLAEAGISFRFKTRKIKAE